MGNYIKSTPAFSGGTVSGNTEFVGDLSGATFYSGSTPLTQIIENLIPTGNTLPSGDYGQVQVNENGVFAGSPNFLFYGLNTRLIFGNNNSVDLYSSKSAVIGGNDNRIYEF